MIDTKFCFSKAGCKRNIFHYVPKAMNGSDGYEYEMR
jgi:hypothetical protein